MPSSCRRISAAPSSASRIRSPALSCATTSLTTSHSGVAYSGCEPDVEVEPGAVLEEDVRGAAPVHDPSEQVPSDLVGRQAPLPAERAGDAVLVLEPEDAPVHASKPTPGSGANAGTQLSRRAGRRSRLPSRRRNLRRCGPGAVEHAGLDRVGLDRAALGRSRAPRPRSSPPSARSHPAANRVCSDVRQVLGVPADRDEPVLVGHRAVEQDVVDRRARRRRRRPRRRGSRPRRASSAG